MEEFVYQECVIASCEFAARKLMYDVNYNYYNDLEEKHKLEQQWNNLLKTFPNYSESGNLYFNRKKLGFLLSNFHVISAERGPLRLDQEYVSSDQYIGDIYRLERLLYDLISKWPDKLPSNLSCLTKDNSRNLNFKYQVKQLFRYNFTFSLPTSFIIPNELSFRNVISFAHHYHRVPKRSHSYIISRRNILNDRFEINPLLQEIDEQDIIKKINAISITSENLLVDIGTSCPPYEDICVHCPDFIKGVSDIFEYDSGVPLTRFLRSKCSNSYLQTTNTPMRFIFEKHEMKKFAIPINIKTTGIHKAFRSRHSENNQQFISLINECVGQALLCNSRISIAVDQWSVLFIELDQENYMCTERSQCLSRGFEYNIKFNVALFDHSTSKYNLMTLLSAFTLDYVKNVDRSVFKQSKALLHQLKFTPQEREREKQFRISVVARLLQSRFRNFKLKNTTYVSSDDSSISIDAGYFGNKYIEYEGEPFKKESFQFLAEYSNFTNNFYLTESARVIYRSDGPNKNKEMYLKIYNLEIPHLKPPRKVSFYKILNTILSMYLREIQIYRSIKGYLQDHIFVARNSSHDYKPRLYQYGYASATLEGKINLKSRGFYILSDYTNHSSLSEFYFMHDTKLLLDNIHMNNGKVNFTKIPCLDPELYIKRKNRHAVKKIKKQIVWV
ncbi:uncharacterized protein RJT21DRAFT_4767 [Scheffersomyces amazonensis]|uniref:uncharacterized protein n=1 Tax=Scheffersomyces amazonensis TaxID=1078765 RepID=UPI00315DB2AD